VFVTYPWVSDSQLFQQSLAQRGEGERRRRRSRKRERYGRRMGRTRRIRRVSGQRRERGGGGKRKRSVAVGERQAGKTHWFLENIHKFDICPVGHSIGVSLAVGSGTTTQV
jgi:hypothetical protein